MTLPKHMRRVRSTPADRPCPVTGCRGRLTVQIDTLGRVVEVPCPGCERRRAGLCRDCPATIPSPRRMLCDACRVRSARESERRYRERDPEKRRRQWRAVARRQREGWDEEQRARVRERVRARKAQTNARRRARTARLSREHPEAYEEQVLAKARRYYREHQAEVLAKRAARWERTKDQRNAERREWWAWVKATLPDLYAKLLEQQRQRNRASRAKKRAERQVDAAAAQGTRQEGEATHGRVTIRQAASSPA